MKIRDIQSEEMYSGHLPNIFPKSSSHVVEERGSTEIISKYSNYHITEIVTDLRRNEVTEISKITKETLENIIGGYVCIKRQDIFGKNNVTTKCKSLEERGNFTVGTSYNLGDSSKLLTHVEKPKTGNYTRQCYVRMEYNEMIESLQNKLKKNSKPHEKIIRNKSNIVVCNNNNNEETKSIHIMNLEGHDSRISDLLEPAQKKECASHKLVFKETEFWNKDCYIKIKKDRAIESMQNGMEKISGTLNGDAKSFICNILDHECDENREPQKIVSMHETGELSTWNSAHKGQKRKTFIEYHEDKDMNCKNNKHQRCENVNTEMENKSELSGSTFNSFFPSKKMMKKVMNDMCHYERENNILIYENLRIENSLNKARSRIKLLENELNNFKRINNYSFLKKYFNENEITALIENAKIDWCNKMITKALQLRFACGNAGYEELLKKVHLPCLRILRNRVHDSQFDLALLAKDMIHF